MKTSTCGQTYLAAMALLAAPFAAAQPVRPVAIRIDAQPLNSALNAWAQQTGYSLLVPYDRESDSRRAPNVVGEYTPEDALARLLASSPLKYEFVNPKTVAIRIADGRAASDAQPDHATKEKAVSRQRPTPISKTDAQTVESSQRAGGGRGLDSAGLPEVLVKGSRALNIDIRRTSDDIQPYAVFDRADIGRAGVSNVEDFLKYQLTMSAGFMSQNQQAGPLGNLSSINLRGLGSDQTLILIDGRRAPGIILGGRPQQPDLNGIPLSAIERIEVLPTTASGIYGGTATGGVINIVLRRDYSGIETGLRYESPFQGGTVNRRIDLSGGASANEGRTSFLVTASYSDASSLLAEERDLVQRGRAAVLNNNPAAILGSSTPPLGATTNIRSSNGANLTLKSGASLNSPITYAPPGYAGAASDGGAALVTNAGKYNLDLAETAQSNGGRQGLLNSPSVTAIDLTVRHDFGSNISTFIEASGSKNSSVFARSEASSTFTIPSSAPTNPFTNSIRVTTPAFGADGTVVSDILNKRALAGLILDLSHAWRAEADYTWSRSRFSASIPGALTAAAATATSSGTLDVLRDAGDASGLFTPFVAAPTVYQPVYSTLKDATLRASGPALRLPGGDVVLALLVERREEHYGEGTQTQPSREVFFPSREQSVDSASAEARLPIVSAANALPGLRLLEMQLAIRRDNYTVDGATNSVTAGQPISRFRNRRSSTDPTFGLRYQPVNGFTLRASYGTGYLPPAVNQLVPSVPITLPGSLLGLTDPRRGNEPLGTITISGGGDPALRPETSRSESVGMIWTPSFLTGLRASIDWTKIKKTDNIASVATLTESDFNNESVVPGLITRGPVPAGDAFGVGPVGGINSGLFNVSKARIESYDFAVDCPLEFSAAGLFQVTLRATRLVHLQTQLTSASPTIENAGVSATAFSGLSGGGGLRWKANGTLTWKRGGWMLSWTSRFFDSYWVNTAHTYNASQGSATVPSQMYHDVFGSYQFSRFENGGLKALSNVQVEFGVRNVFDKKPPVDVIGILANPNGYSLWGDPRLASYYLGLRKTLP